MTSLVPEAVNSRQIGRDVEKVAHMLTQGTSISSSRLHLLTDTILMPSSPRLPVRDLPPRSHHPRAPAQRPPAPFQTSLPDSRARTSPSTTKFPRRDFQEGHLSIGGFPNGFRYLLVWRCHAARCPAFRFFVCRAAVRSSRADLDAVSRIRKPTSAQGDWAEFGYRSRSIIRWIRAGSSTRRIISMRGSRSRHWVCPPSSRH
jgi:hypothetical protein